MNDRFCVQKTCCQHLLAENECLGCHFLSNRSPIQKTEGCNHMKCTKVSLYNSIFSLYFYLSCYTQTYAPNLCPRLWLFPVLGYGVFLPNTMGFPCPRLWVFPAPDYGFSLPLTMGFPCPRLWVFPAPDYGFFLPKSMGVSLTFP